MIGWILKKLKPETPSSPQRGEVAQAVSTENCALWHDVVRALDAKPKSAK